MTEKKKKKRRAYLDDFHKNEKGSYDYRGALYVWQGEEEQLHKELLRLWLLCIGMFAALTAAGCVEAPGTANCAYVLIPYVISFVSGIAVCWGMGRLSAGGASLRAYIYQASVEQIPGRSICTAVGSGAAIVGEVVFTCRNGMNGGTAGFLFFLFLEGAALTEAIAIYRRMKRMDWKKLS